MNPLDDLGDDLFEDPFATGGNETSGQDDVLICDCTTAIYRETSTSNAPGSSDLYNVSDGGLFDLPHTRATYIPECELEDDILTVMWLDPYTDTLRYVDASTVFEDNELFMSNG